MKLSKWVLAAGGLGLLLLSRRATATPAIPGVQPPSGGSFVAEGVASFYGPGFDGKLTASGAVFNQNAMTAAHRTLRFGTRLKVTDLDNGLSVLVTVDDRGPFAKDSSGRFTRCIDLSVGAARVIGLDIQRGLARVRLERA